MFAGTLLVMLVLYAYYKRREVQTVRVFLVEREVASKLLTFICVQNNKTTSIQYVRHSLILKRSDFPSGDPLRKKLLYAGDTILPGETRVIESLVSFIPSVVGVFRYKQNRIPLKKTFHLI